MSKNPKEKLKIELGLRLCSHVELVGPPRPLAQIAAILIFFPSPLSSTGSMQFFGHRLIRRRI